MDKIVTYRLIEEKIKPSDFYHGLLGLAAIILVPTDVYTAGLCILIMFLFQFKKVANKFDYKKVQLTEKEVK